MLNYQLSPNQQRTKLHYYIEKQKMPKYVQNLKCA